MDRYRGDRSGDRPGDGGRNPRTSRWSSSDSPTNQPHRYPRGDGGGGGGGGGGESFSGGRHHPYRGPQDYPPGGGGGPGFHGGPGGFSHQMPMGGPRRGGGRGGFGRGGSPEKMAGSNFAKLFVGSVPRTATEEDIRPLFEEHGDVIEVALIKDKRTGQQQSCCFIKYATSEEADRAIRALHNQYTLPGGLGPIQVRYADGERERLGAVEHKLFVGSLDKQATEKEVEEIFSPYGHVEDVYLMRDDMKQSRGCGFVKFSNREMATAAINALNGIYVMMGCDQPLIVRFADPKRPRPGESRGGPAFGGPGFGPRSQPQVGFRPTHNLGEPMGGHMPFNAWHPPSPQSLEPSSQPDTSGVPGGSLNGSLSNLAVPQSSSSQQGFNPPMAQIQPVGQQILPSQKPLMSPQHLTSSLQMHHSQQTSASNLQAQTSPVPKQQHSQLQIPQYVGFSFSQALPSQQLVGLGGQLPASQSSIQHNMSGTALQIPLSLQQQGMSAAASQQQLPTSTISQQMLQPPVQQTSSQLTQALLQQQAQALQLSFQSSQQAISQLQQQLQLIQPSNLSQQQSSQAAKQQSPWSGIVPQSISSIPTSAPASVMPSTVSTTPSLPVATQSAVPLTCNWTEHTSPEGYKYYYNSVTRESRWEKPEELTIYEHEQQKLRQPQQQQQQQQKLVAQQLQSPSQTQSHTQIQSQQVSQTQQAQPQMQLRQQPQLQFLQPSLSYQTTGVAGQQNIQDYNYAQLQGASSVIDPSRVQQGIQAAQELMWKNKPAGS